jgi:tetratricopeptide (TPR) repeat protein
MKKILYILLSIFVLSNLWSCEKFLLERPSNSVANISSLLDLQMLMDAANVMNYGGHSALLEAATDDFFLGKVGFERNNELMQAIYLWKPDHQFLPLDVASHWTDPFKIISVANIVLDELPQVDVTKGLSRDVIEGTALFHRAFTYLHLVQVYCKAYDPATSGVDLGLPMRLSSDIDLPSRRSSLEETYSIIEKDVQRAIELLPETTLYQTRPSRAAAHALLAKLYLLMDRYLEALEQADLALAKHDILLDFNTLDASRPYPIQAMNDETLFFAYAAGASLLNPAWECYIDTLLYDSYHHDDLRKTIFFKDENNGYHTFRGSFRGTGNSTIFIGLTTSELLLIQAECSARLGMIDRSLNSLNRLLENRYDRDRLEPVSVSDSHKLLEIVLKERRKEMIFRGVRWGDLKRLNRDPRFAKTLHRSISGYETTYTLPPQDLRYVYLLPQSVIELTGMTQNPR